MNDENNDNLDVVFGNCKNNFQLFLSTIAKYLAKKLDLAACDLTQVSELFKEAANTSNNHNAKIHETVNDTTNASKNVQTSKEDSCDLFENDNLNNNQNDTDDEVIPETQFSISESNDSGESVCIPLYSTKKSSSDNFKCSSDDDNPDESQFARIRPDSRANDYTEPQSQMLMANLDHSLLRECEITNTSKNVNSLQLSSTTRNKVAQNEAYSTDSESEDENRTNTGDRSGCTTPDLDFFNDVPGNRKEKSQDETQILSESMLNISKQQVNQVTPQKSVEIMNSSDDIFLAETQLPNLLFKEPAAISTPRIPAKQKRSVTAETDIFDAETQKIVTSSNNQKNEDIFEAATQAPPNNNNNDKEDDIFAVATQLPPNNNDKEEDIFGAATQAPPNNNDKEEDIFKMDTQIAPADVFEAATQKFLQPEKSVTTKKAVTWKENERSDAKNTNTHNSSDDLFDANDENEDNLNETEVFDMQTQALDMAAMARKRFPAVMTQNSQPANTPEWSLAARISTAQIDHFEKEQAQREAEKQRERLIKNRGLFYSSDEEENDDDLEFDLPTSMPERVNSFEQQKRRKPMEDLDLNSDDEDFPSKKSKPEVTSNKASLRHVSVKLVKNEVAKLMQTDDSYEKKTLSGQEESKRSSSSRKTKESNKTESREVRSSRKIVAEEPPKNGTLETKKADKEQSKKVESREVRNVRKTISEETVQTERYSNKRKVEESKVTASEKLSSNRKSEKRKTIETETRQSKRKAQSAIQEDPLPQKERGERKERKEPKVASKSKLSATASEVVDTKSLRNTRKDNQAKGNDNSAPTGATRSITERQRLSSRKSFSRQAILFTKVNSAPYINVIQNLGGFIVDTPQLGTILICDKISRTFKFLYALSKGIPIVSSRWLDASAKSGRFEPTDPYLAVDTNSEKRFHFSLKKSLETARKTPLFTNYYVFATPNVQPTTDEIMEIVNCCGGVYAENALKKRKPNTIAVLISHKKDSKLWKIYKDAHPDIQIVSSEGFMQSVVQQRINFSDYLLT